jgi:hypothetical protein
VCPHVSDILLFIPLPQHTSLPRTALASSKHSLVLYYHHLTPSNYNDPYPIPTARTPTASRVLNNHRPTQQPQPHINYHATAFHHYVRQGTTALSSALSRSYRYCPRTTATQDPLFSGAGLIGIMADGAGGTAVFITVGIANVVAGVLLGTADQQRAV